MDGVLLELEVLAFTLDSEEVIIFLLLLHTSKSERKCRVLYSRFKEQAELSPHCYRRRLLPSFDDSSYNVSSYSMPSTSLSGCLTCHSRIVVFGAVFGNISRQLSRTIL
jgi:hypothetical protein